jgi:hypothetical protein
MANSIVRLLILLTCISHVVGCIWWYIGTVHLDLDALPTYEESLEATDSAAQANDTYHAPGRRRLMLEVKEGAVTIPSAVDENGNIYQLVQPVYQPYGRAVEDSWVFYYQGLGVQDLWSDRYELLTLVHCMIM